MVERAVEHGVLGLGMAYLKLGSGEPLVVAAGLSPNHQPPSGLGLLSQLRQLRPLARERTVWWVNRRPGLAPNASMADIAADYARALRATFDGPVDVVGISTGGSVALQLTVDHPELVRRLVLVASGSRLGTWGRRAQQELAEEIRANHPRAAAARASSMAGATPASGAVLGVGGWLLGPAHFAIAAPQDILATLHAEDGFDVGARLGEIGVPVLVVGGGRDRIYENGRVFIQTADRIAGARLILYRHKGHLGVLSGRVIGRDALSFLDEGTPGPARPGRFVKPAA
ncbi:MAG: alpha/beta fold hydrolase [Cellulomonas sp.]